MLVGVFLNLEPVLDEHAVATVHIGGSLFNCADLMYILCYYYCYRDCYNFFQS